MLILCSDGVDDADGADGADDGDVGDDGGGGADDGDGVDDGDGSDIQCRGVLCKSMRTSAPLSITKPSPTNPPTLHTFAMLKLIFSLFETNFNDWRCMICL